MQSSLFLEVRLQVTGKDFFRHAVPLFRKNLIDYIEGDNGLR